MKSLCRQGTDAAAASPARESQFLELQERAASLQAALSNSESQRQGLEVELNGLRNDLDSLRSQAANTVHPLEVEQRLREVPLVAGNFGQISYNTSLLNSARCGGSDMVKWLRCLAFTQESRVQFPVSELVLFRPNFWFPVQVTDLLYQKQSQIEKMAAERSARQMAWERDLASVREDAERVKRQVVG